MRGTLISASCCLLLFWLVRVINLILALDGHLKTTVCLIEISPHFSAHFIELRAQ